MDNEMGIDEEFFLLRQDLLLFFGETLIEFLDFRFVKTKTGLSSKR